ncbi:PAS domain-containing protein [Leptospira sp. severe_002]|uniref:PAS domain-containing protein n=1 Tax=Leptospira sp. severe_002 TaxID=2838237 RepID=UPI001E54B7A9|nr:PAS domain-containing protein [Leptospira sp. severe_002]
MFGYGSMWNAAIGPEVENDEEADIVRASGFSDELVGQRLVQAKSEAIVACDRDGVIRLWNPGAERMFGFSRNEALGQTLDIIIPERFRSRHWDGFHTMMRTGQSRYADGALLAVPGLRRDGSLISIEFTIAPIRDESDEVVGLVSVIRDVTKTFEQLRALRKEVERSGNGR